MFSEGGSRRYVPASSLPTDAPSISTSPFTNMASPVTLWLTREMKRGDQNNATDRKKKKGKKTIEVTCVAEWIFYRLNAHGFIVFPVSNCRPCPRNDICGRFAKRSTHRLYDIVDDPVVRKGSKIEIKISVTEARFAVAIKSASTKSKILAVTTKSQDGK